MERESELNLKEIHMLIDLFKINLDSKYNYTNLANILGTSIYDAKFQHIKKWLKDNDIITEDHNFLPSVILKINKKKLMEEIPEIDIIKRLHEDLIYNIYGSRVWIYK